MIDGAPTKNSHLKVRGDAGFGLVQVIIAMALVAILGVGVSSLMENANKGNRSMRLQGIASGIESQVRASLNNGTALMQTRTGNAELNTCVTQLLAGSTCGVSGPRNLKLRNAANTQFLSDGTSPFFLNDASDACSPQTLSLTSNPPCQWKTTATWSNSNVVGDTTIKVVFSLEWARPPAAPASYVFLMAPKKIQIDIPVWMFTAVTAVPTTAAEMCASLGGAWNPTATGTTPKCTLSPALQCASLGTGYTWTGTKCRPPQPTVSISNCTHVSSPGDYVQFSPHGRFMVDFDVTGVPGAGGQLFSAQGICCQVSVTFP